MTTLQIDVDSLLAGLLLSVRLGMVLFLTPALGSAGVPVRIRLLVLVSLSVWMTTALSPIVPANPGHTPGLVIAMVNEVLWGGLLGFGLQAAFASFQVGGKKRGAVLVTPCTVIRNRYHLT